MNMMKKKYLIPLQLSHPFLELFQSKQNYCKQNQNCYQIPKILFDIFVEDYLHTLACKNKQPQTSYNRVNRNVKLQGIKVAFTAKDWVFYKYITSVTLVTNSNPASCWLISMPGISSACRISATSFGRCVTGSWVNMVSLRKLVTLEKPPRVVVQGSLMNF